jgi:hypothetical protein
LLKVQECIVQFGSETFPVFSPQQKGCLGTFVEGIEKVRLALGRRMFQQVIPRLEGLGTTNPASRLPGIVRRVDVS